jgi:NADH-quinone oxidoreductase subunit N
MTDIFRFSPELALLIAAGVIIIVDALIPLAGKQVYQNRRWISVLFALVGIAASAGLSGALIAADEKGPAFDGMIVVDDFSLFFGFLFAGVVGMIVLGSIDFLERNRFQAEYLALVLTAASAMMMMAAATDLIMIFIALETQAIAFYVLVGFQKDAKSSEAALKYLLLGATSTALTLYGMAYLFGLSGETSLDGIAAFVADADSGSRSALVLAAVFLAAGFGFKMAIVPFQMWVPDVYQGAPTPVTAYLSVASKAAGFAVALRVFASALGEGLISSDWSNLFAALAVVSMVLGNVMALVQKDIKRLLGYSSIAQAGTFLIGMAAIAANDPQAELGTSSVMFFIGTYAFTNLGAFMSIIAISHRIGSDEISAYAGLYKRSPMLALALAACLISLTGIPPTAGFIAKVYVFNAAVEADMVWLALVGVLASVISAYYYLGVVMTMFTREPEVETTFQPSPYLAGAVLIAVAGVLAIGVYPNPLIQASESAASIFVA